MKSGEAKSRLSPTLSPEERGELGGLLLGNVLAAVEGAGLIESCYVVSSDAGTLRAAARKGAKTVPEPGDSGVNGAVERGVRAAGNPESVLVFPSDLPLLGQGDVRHLLSLHEDGFAVVISPSLAFDGTNALLYPTRSGFPLSYDRDSFWNHLRGAGGKGLSAAVCVLEDIMLDVDTPSDLSRLALSRSRAPAADFARRILR